MLLSRAALELGLQLVQVKLGQAMGVPGFSVYAPEEEKQRLNRLPQSSNKRTNTRRRLHISARQRLSLPGNVSG